MTELVVPEVVDEQFKEHYQGLIRSSLLRSVGAEEQQTRKRGRRRRSHDDAVALNGVAPGPASPAERPPPWPAVASEVAERPPSVAKELPPPVETEPAWPAVVPASPAPLPAPEAARRARLRGSIKIVWLVAVVLLVSDALVFGVESWASGLADVAVLVLTVVWFLVSSDARDAAPVDAPIVVAEPEPEPEPEPEREPEPEPAPDPEPQAVEGIAGLQVIPLQMERDAGGHLTKLLQTGDCSVSWRAVSCRAGTLRGMHAHVRGDGCRIVVEGKVALGLKDLRPGSVSEGRAEVLELSAQEYTGVVIPAGVAHGLYAQTDALVLVTLTALDEEEYSCAWDDPGLEIRWPGEPLFLSERDRRAGSLEDLRAEIAALLV